MIRHIALFRCKEGTSPEAIGETLRALRTLPDRVPGVRRFHAGADLGLIEGTYDFCVVADFDDEDAYLAYAGHPEHSAVSEAHVLPIVSDLARVQIDVE